MREVLVTMLPLVLLLEYGHSVTGIVGELIRVASIECFAMTEILAQLVGTRAWWRDDSRNDYRRDR